ncbi:hypothetical protein ACHAP5_000506 [Fusarium lateritium]
MGCFSSTLKAQKDVHDKLSDTSSTCSSSNADSTTAQADFNHRQESENQEQPLSQPREEPSSPRTAFAERLWTYWHETECSNLANCTHSFYATYTGSPTRCTAPISSSSGSHYTLRGSEANSNRSSENPQPFEFDARTSSISARRNQGTDGVRPSPPVAMLRRTRSESKCQTAVPLAKSPSHTA